jgi:hypothetical protein
MLDAFEPDYLVQVDCELPSGIDFPPERIFNIASVFSESDVKLGLDVRDVFADLYEKEFRFKLRHPEKFLIAEPADAQSTLLSAVCFGRFPTSDKPRSTHAVYKYVFSPKVRQIDEKHFLEYFRANHNFPNRIANEELSEFWHGSRREPTIFYFDHTRLLDLIDYWNLRSLGRRVIPLPASWAANHSKECEEFIKQHFAPYRENENLMHSTSIMCSRNVKIGELQKFASTLSVPQGSVMLTESYPRLWDAWDRKAGRTLRCAVEAEKRDVDGDLWNDSALHFKPLLPTFVNERGATNNAVCANVIEALPFSAQVIPPGLDAQKLLGSFGKGSVWVNREGIVFASGRFVGHERWQLPTPTKVFTAWTKERGFRIDLSGAGRITNELIEAMGGPYASFIFRHEEILRKLNEMAHGIAESELETNDGVKKPKIRGKVVSESEWRGVLLRTCENDATIAQNHLDSLVQMGVLQPGLRFQCSECGQHTWFSINELREKLTCERCLKPVPFPKSKPPKNWFYRAVGPYAVENYAHGGYCVALALRFFMEGFAAASWIPSFTIKGISRSIEMEADFGMFWQESRFTRASEPYLIVGECKTFDMFKSSDVARMRELGKSFPGAALVFATLRKKLAQSEKKLIAKLARAGRKHLKAGRLLNPVIVLTGIELQSISNPPHCWEEAGPPYDKFARYFIGNRDDKVSELADVTQQLHLEIEPYWEWLEAKNKKRLKAKSDPTKVQSGASATNTQPTA